MTRLHEKSLKVLFRVRTRQRDFTIISNHCWGADLYPMLGLPYLTPFVALVSLVIAWAFWYTQRPAPVVGVKHG